jgi:hypothetical protein
MNEPNDLPREDEKVEAVAATSESEEVAEVDSLAAADVPVDAEAVAETAVEIPELQEAERDSALALRLEAKQKTADEVVYAESRRHTRRDFVVAGAAAAAGYGFYRWLAGATGVEMQPAPLRKAFETNAAIARVITGDHALAPTYALDKARDLRVNGVYGLKRMLDPASWRLQLVGSAMSESHPRFSQDVTGWEYRYTAASSGEDQGHDTKVDPNAKTAGKMAPAAMMDVAKAGEERAGRMPRGSEEAGESRSTLAQGTPGLLLTIEDITALPRYELVTQFKCIEGWSEIVHWAGVRMADFMDTYPPQKIDGREPRYVYMETPDGDYYTGYDMEVCRHPQTLLVTEMMGASLGQYHGAPLRLHMPTKYGYKQIKRIGLIAYTNDKPDDYWTKLGYDWYAGL